MYPFLYVLAIGLLGILIYLILDSVVFVKKANKAINKKLDEYFNNKDYSLEDGNKLYDRMAKNYDDKIYFKYIRVPSNSQITINSKETWKLSYGGNSKNVGRAYPSSRYLKEIEEFAKKEFDGKKIFIIYKSTEHILRYLNECELETITIEKTPYGYKLICFDNFDKEMDYTLNN